MSQPLQQRNTRVLMTWLPLVMLAGSVFFYLIVIGHIRHMKQQQLLLKQTNVWNAFVRNPSGTPRRLPGEYTISRIGRSYIITTYISAKEYRHLLIKIGVAEAMIFVVLLIVLILVNRRASVRLWRPFYSTMKAVRGYDIRQNKTLLLDTDTGIEEFDRLNQTLMALIDHVDQAYRNQKQFTENASHELQTPLAIIRSKVELLMEDAGLDEDRAQLLQEITEANERLSQMNKNLLLLTRIENGLFPEVEPIAFGALVGRLSGFFREYHEDEAIRTSVSIQPDVTIFANPALIEVLVGNLLRNAYIHNLPNGWVNVELSDKALVIKNSGPVLDSDPERLFDRFRKGRVDNRTTGLGLALVRQIAQLYQYEIRYTYQDGVHRLWVLLKRDDA